jgi:hypothetical protein
MKRKAPTLRQKLASALLTIRRENAHGALIPVIEYEDAKHMTADQIIAHFHFDHGVFAAWGGPNDPWNLTPRPVREHIDKTKRDVKAIAKVRRAEKKRLGLKKSRPIPGSRATAFRKKLSGQVERRA